MSKRYDGILLASDYDHTLSSCSYSNWDDPDYMIKAIPERNVSAIKHFVANGGTFVVVSGRNPDEVASLAKYFPMEDLFVASNGTTVYSASENRPYFSQTMDDGCKDILRYLYKTQPEFDFFRITDNSFIFRFWYKGDDIEKVLSLPHLPIYKIITSSNSADPTVRSAISKTFRDEIKKKFGDRYKIEMSSAFTVEICPKGSDKSNALRVLVDELERRRGKKFDKIVCVGDNQNDLEMVKSADIGIAVGNAIDEIKKVAKFVTINSDDGAIAKVIEDIL